MGLNKNEKEVLKLLIRNASLTNVEIAREIRVTAQAVGKIKKKLESNKVITGYPTNVNLEFLGVKVLALALFAYKPDATPSERKEHSMEAVKKHNVLSFFKIPEGDVTHAVVYGFENLTELEEYFQKMPSEKDKSELKRLYIFSPNGLIKNSLSELAIHALSN